MTRQKIIKPIQTIAQQVFKILEEEILSGKYKPGDRLIEREIGDRLGISRIPVREALLSLERWGLVIATGRNRKGREGDLVQPPSRQVQVPGGHRDQQERNRGRLFH